MTRRITATVALLGLAAALAATPTFAASKASGYFRYDKLTLKVAHAYLFRTPEDEDPSKFETKIYLTSLPIDAAAAARAFDPGHAIDEQIQGKAGGYVRICVNDDGSECGMYFNHNEPSESFNTSGSGEFKLTSNTPAHVGGSWKLAEPSDFFDKTYQFDLNFEADLSAPPPSKPLPADGGEPGRAYAAYLAALDKGDIPALRKALGEAGAWRFPEGDDSSNKEQLKWMRDGKPRAIKILKAESLDADHAVLTVEGVDRDDIKRRGRVLMVRQDGLWQAETESLSSVDD